jgi:hypothetical protein
MRVIYKTTDGVSVIVPSPEALAEYGIEAIAKKDVPAGVPYKIVDVSEIPSDRTFRNAWDIDEALLTDGVGDESNQFPPTPEPAPAVETPVVVEPAPTEEPVQ